MALYQVADKGIHPVDEISFAHAGLRERQDLQQLLKRQIEVVAPDVLVIAEELDRWEDRRRRIDLLAVDKAANLVVIELKRTEDGGHMELQALRYAAMVSTMTLSMPPEDRLGSRCKRRILDLPVDACLTTGRNSTDLGKGCFCCLYALARRIGESIIIETPDGEQIPLSIQTSVWRQ